ncbi:hypothetical protein M501DRAFT_1016371 [Patellaria atrata CBS 101060]|uniref:ATPase inhibitor, mitochondrial n=1 Tax=Patellaria atrata CBS 101060 TaxID=1346257 RepID=A0A9P4SB68_9PEZI|nr:hypothetical protein M501DRAFT_1016371 [Patellaria atrata CBS 101060]
MMRTSIIRSIRPLQATRALSTTARAMTEGATGSGSSRPGGMRSGDAFSKREHASEELYIRAEEKQKLRALQERLKQSEQHMREMREHLEEQERKAGGEQN